MSSLYMAQASEHQQLEWLEGSTISVLLDAAATDGQLMMQRISADRGEGPPLHKHLYEDEIFLLLSGEAQCWYEDRSYELHEGGVVFLPRDVPHSYQITSEHSDLLVLTTPAGAEEMFRAIGRDRSVPRSDDSPVVPNPEISERYGNIVLGPPPFSSR